MWSESGGLQYITCGVGVRRPDTAVAINDAGRVVGLTRDSYIYIRDAARGIKQSQGRVDSVYGLNNLDQVVGIDGKSAFVWTVREVKKRLPRPEGDGKGSCSAQDIDDGGMIVGVCSGRPALWMLDETGEYRAANLFDLIDFPPDTPRWRLEKSSDVGAQKINASGQILVVFRSESPDYDTFNAILTPIR